MSEKENGGTDGRWRSLAEKLIAVMVGAGLTMLATIWAKLERLSDRLDAFSVRSTQGESADAAAERDRLEMFRRLDKLEKKIDDHAERSKSK